jgi:hypothetical protein
MHGLQAAYLDLCSTFELAVDPVCPCPLWSEVGLNNMLVFVVFACPALSNPDLDSWQLHQQQVTHISVSAEHFRWAIINLTDPAD